MSNLDIYKIPEVMSVPLNGVPHENCTHILSLMLTTALSIYAIVHNNLYTGLNDLFKPPAYKGVEVLSSN